MRLFGLDFSVSKAAVAATDLAALDSRVNGRGWMAIGEPFSGAWQRNIEADGPQDVLAFSAVYACVSRIADDISKLRIKLTQRDDNGIWNEVIDASPFLAVLRKPNPYQTRIQFLSNWLVSKLLTGNAYIIKRRDKRRMVTSMYVLDPRLVTPLVTETGEVYYQLATDNLAGVQTVTVPASEIIHDRMIAPWHPLVGISPIYACAISATQGRRIQSNSAKFFANMSRPSGILTAPGVISDPLATRLRREFEKNFSGNNIGRLFVAGDGLKYEPMTIPAQEAQLIEQLKWTVEDIARCFHVPLYKIGAGPTPNFSNVAALNQEYYTETLQVHMEAMEILLDEGLGLLDVPGKTYGTEIDVDALLRLDPVARADAYEKAIRAGWLSPNEARWEEDRAPVEGGDSPLIQQQNYSLEALAKRDAKEDPFAPGAPSLPPPPADQPSKEAIALWVEAVQARTALKLQEVRHVA